MTLHENFLTFQSARVKTIDDDLAQRNKSFMDNRYKRIQDATALKESLTPEQVKLFGFFTAEFDRELQILKEAIYQQGFVDGVIIASNL